MKIYRLRAGQADEKPLWVCIARGIDARGVDTSGSTSVARPSLAQLLAELAALGLMAPGRAA